MPYSYITLSALKIQLASRLGDPNQRFWVSAELSLYIKEAMRCFGICSAFWRDRGTLTASPSLAFYDIASNLSDGSELILSYSVTDRDLIKEIEYHLLESAASQAAWNGTSMFGYDEVVSAIQNRRNQFLSDTGAVLTRSLQVVSSPPIGREQLADDVIDVRRAAWLGSPPENYYTHLWREDEISLTAANQTWMVNDGAPTSYSVMAPPPLTLQVAPPPSNAGQVELITVNAGSDLSPSSSATILGIPDDLCWVVKWGAIADLLGKDGEARDPQRAMFAEQRYQQGVELARTVPVVLNGELNGVPLIADNLLSIDGREPNWQNNLDRPSTIAVLGLNMIALNPVPDDIYSVTLDVVRRTPVPAFDSQQIQLGREQLDMILDYAEHLALFKVGGEEWMATQRGANNFLMQSMTYNQRLSAAARYAVAARDKSSIEKTMRPRRLEGVGLGSLK